MIDVNSYADIADARVYYDTPQTDLLKLKPGAVIFAHDANVAMRCVVPVVVKPYILVTARDIPVTDTMLALTPPNMVKWFGNNVTANGPRSQGIPIGVPPLNVGFNEGDGATGQEKRDALQIAAKGQKKHGRDGLLYVNHLTGTNPSERSAVYSMFQGQEWATCKGGPARIPFGEYIDDMCSHRFVACPAGGGTDTHRVWESLLLGATPIVKRHPAMEWFSELPIMFVDDWSEVTQDALEEYKPHGNKQQMLREDYWLKMIRDAVK